MTSLLVTSKPPTAGRSWYGSGATGRSRLIVGSPSSYGGRMGDELTPYTIAVPDAALADPPDPTDAFHVVVPSLPGFGFSGKPAKLGWGPDRIARAWAVLMTRLGYDRFGAQGGDWGAAVTSALAAQESGRVVGMHLNYAPWPARDRPRTDDLTDDERRGVADTGYHLEWCIGYALEHGTRPQALVYALVDSPVCSLSGIRVKY